PFYSIQQQIRLNSTLDSVISDHYASTTPIKTLLFDTFLKYPSEWTATTLMDIHNLSGLPWWATIALTTVIFRISVGCSMYYIQQRMSDKLEEIHHKIRNELQPQLNSLRLHATHRKVATAQQTKNEILRATKKLSKAKYAQENIHPGKLIILTLFQSVPWVYLTMAIRMICATEETQMTVSKEGILWFENIAQADPYAVLPIIFLVFGMANITFQSIKLDTTNTSKMSIMFKIQRTAFRLIVIGFTIIALKLPALIQNILFELPSARKRLGLKPSKFGNKPITKRYILWKNNWKIFTKTLKWNLKL
ncbi:unnamed protein product, partial [Didymodactylos carnosus]